MESRTLVPRLDTALDESRSRLPATPTRRRRDHAPDERPLIGWREWVHLPDLLDLPIKAKVDTGARTSAIHAFDVHEFEQDGQPWVEFSLHPVQRHRLPEARCLAPVLDRRHVTSSNGQRQLRIAIRTTASIGGIEWPIELTLTDRDTMGFRMLLGREAVRRRFIIDPGRSYRLSGRNPVALRHTEETSP